MKLVKRSVLAVVIAAACAPAIASLTDAERADAIEQFQQSSAIINGTASDITDSSLNEAERTAFQSLTRLGVKSEDIPDLIANYHFLTTPEAVEFWVKYPLNGSNDSALAASNAERTAEQAAALHDARFQHLKEQKAEQATLGAALVSANADRTAEQAAALHDARFQHLKEQKAEQAALGAALVSANADRTAEQAGALHDA
ncbi:hypothetical protein MXM41_22235, partial [Leclercia adecarboxylata]|uniref:hypothetical protein n=1 Tax=Leclercia adecarboxylata TaxID=83655 RepID=UPI002DBE672C